MTGRLGEVLDRFVAERLITVDADTAQITHEALLTAWPLLRTWIDANREGLRVRRRLSDSARAWDETGREPAALLRGGQLALARDWAADPFNRDSLGTLTRDFVEAGIVQERLQEAAERNRARRLRRLVAALTVLVIVTVALAGYAFQQREAATTARDNATGARNSAQSREVAIEADQARGQNASVAAQLSLAAYRITPTADARSSLLESTGSPVEARLIDTAGVVQAVSLSPDHRVLAVAAADGTLRLWNVTRPDHPVPLGGALLPVNRHEPLYAVAFSPDGGLLAAAGAGRDVLLWSMREPDHPARLPSLTGPANTVYSLAFGARGSLLAAGSADKTVRLWNVTDPAHPQAAGKPLTGPASAVQSVAFSPDGRTLAAGSADKTVRLWNVTDPARPAALGQPLTGPAEVVDAVAFSPDGRTLAAGSQDHKVWLWNVTTPGRPVRDGVLTGAASWVNAVAFSPDGRDLAEGSSDDRVLVWNLTTRTPTLTAALPQPQPVTSLAWDTGGHLVAGDADGLVRDWTLPTPVLRAGVEVNSVAYRGPLLAVATNTSLQVWNSVTRTQLAVAAVPGPATTIVNAVAFSLARPVVAAGVRGRQAPALGGGPGRCADPAQPAGVRVGHRQRRGRRLQPGRQSAGHQRRRREGAAVVGDRPGASPAAGHRRGLGDLRVLGGVQPRRAHARGGQRRRAHQAVARQPVRPAHPGRAGRWPGRRATPTRSRSAPMAPPWPWAAPTSRCGCGTSPTRPARSGWAARSPARVATSTRWPSARTGARWPPG